MLLTGSLKLNGKLWVTLSKWTVNWIAIISGFNTADSEKWVLENFVLSKVAKVWMLLYIQFYLHASHLVSWLGTWIHWQFYHLFVHSVEQKSIGLKFSKSRTGSDVRYSCHHNKSRFTFPIFVHSWLFCLPLITINHTAYILTEDDNTFA